MKKAILLLLAATITLLVHGQSPCDSITTDVKYAGFADSLIEITAYNHGHTFFSYPGFILYSANGDTIAKEQVDLFGLGSPSSHKLIIRPGAIPGNTFNGTLQLWTNMYDSINCIYTKSFDLCPDTCVKAYPYFGNYGGAYFFGNFNWVLKNSSLQTIGTGSYTLDSVHQYVEDSIYLFPGTYSLTVTPVGPVTLSGQPVAGIRANGYSSAPQPYAFFTGSTLQVPFTFYKKCISTTSVARPQAGKAISISTNNGILHIDNGGKEVGMVAILNMDGKVVYKETIRESALDIDISYLPKSIYVVNVINSKAQYSQKIFPGL